MSSEGRFYSMKFFLKFSLSILMLSTFANAHASLQASVYGGGNNAFDSVVKYSNNGSPVNNTVHWIGEPFGEPPYYGIRAIYWFDHSWYRGWGLGIDYTHDKVIADPLPPGYTHLEFTDGLNLVTADLFYHFLNRTVLTPYAGFGVGVSVPHVEEITVAPLFPTSTFGYQAAGVALAWLTGVDLRIWRGFSIFGEYKLNYSQNNADLNQGQTLSTNLWVNNFIFGLSYLF